MKDSRWRRSNSCGGTNESTARGSSEEAEATKLISCAEKEEAERTSSARKMKRALELSNLINDTTSVFKNNRSSRGLYASVRRPPEVETANDTSSEATEVQSHADESECWVLNKSFVSSERRFASNGGGFVRERKVIEFGSSGSADSNDWNKKKGESNVGSESVDAGGGRPRLVLQPRSLSVFNEGGMGMRRNLKGLRRQSEVNFDDFIFQNPCTFALDAWASNPSIKSIILISSSRLHKLFNSDDKNFLQTSPCAITMVVHPSMVVGKMGHAVTSQTKKNLAKRETLHVT
ncbi:hypothetical protein VIGAN_03171400 [Vigna angularis var. angularis]|uniref:Uncharacterized protein n=1 Tax=Vigna angularis var. angularis TaxID=157739 RepID=A0A0S3RMJ3_PHAAN|nr:hypothetical protein VIGAN_03171400 [Vigna angularis var. angularis]